MKRGVCLARNLDLYFAKARQAFRECDTKEETNLVRASSDGGPVVGIWRTRAQALA
jgi:hypothetical protein